MRTKKDIYKALREMDPSIKETDEPLAPAVLLASLVVGPNQSKVAKLLKVPQSRIEQYFANLTKAKVFKGGKIYADWGDPENGGTAFWMDVCVAEGLMQRA